MRKILIFLIFLILFSCSTIKTNKNVAIEYFELGNEYYNLAKYDKAVTYFSKSLEYNSNNYDTIINLILSYQKLNKYDNAENIIYKNYKKTISDFSNKLLLLLGNNFYLQGKYNLALKTYEEYLNINKTDSNCLFNIGLSYLKLDEPDNAINYLLKAYDNKNDHIPSIYNIAEYYHSKKDYQKSINFFLLLEKLDSNNSDVFYRLGDLEYLLEEYELSKKHILQAIKLNSKVNSYYILLAKVYSKGYNDRVKTIESLEYAFKNNYTNLSELKTYSEFNLLFEYEEFKKLLKTYNLK